MFTARRLWLQCAVPRDQQEGTMLVSAGTFWQSEGQLQERQVHIHLYLYTHLYTFMHYIYTCEQDNILIHAFFAFLNHPQVVTNVYEDLAALTLNAERL